MPLEHTTRVEKTKSKLKINLRREEKVEKELGVVSICKRKQKEERGTAEVTEEVPAGGWKFTSRLWLSCYTQMRNQAKMWQLAGPWWPSAQAGWRLYPGFR